MRSLLKRTAMWAILASACVLTWAVARADEERSGVTAEKALSVLKEGNAKFVADRPSAKDIRLSRRVELVKGQHPFAAVVTCSDSRVPPEHIFSQGLGDIFVVRIAGNIAEPYTVGSVEYAVEHLHVPLVVVLGHEKCGAVAAALAPEKPGGNLGKLIAAIDTGNPAGSGDAALPPAIRRNATSQMDRMISRSEVLKTSVKKKEVKFVTAIYHLDDGKVEWLSK